MTPLDPLEEVLAPVPAEPAAFRGALAARTSRVVRRRRWLRRARLALAATVLFGAGMATMAWFRPAARDRIADRAPVVKIESERQPDNPPTSADALERYAAGLDGRRRAQAFALAAGKYLDDHNDLDAALRCYGKALDSADASFLEVSPEDDWLVMALKMDRRKEP